MFPLIKKLVTFCRTNEKKILISQLLMGMILKKIADKLDNKKSCEIDGISNIIMKSIINILIKPITIIINQMLKTVVFPDKLKVAKVIPLFKKGDPTLLTHYRPISLLPSLSKIFEKVIYQQLYAYFQTCSLMVNMASVKAIPLKWHL